jgi:hypothetical protein
VALELVQQRDPFCMDGILGAEGRRKREQAISR